MGSIGDLSVELLYVIGEHCTVSAQSALARTSHKFYKILNDEVYKRNVKAESPHVRAITWAARTGSLSTITRCLAHGAKINSNYRHDLNLPFLQLDQSSGNPDFTNFFGMSYGTPLHYAVLGGHQDVVEYLLSRGANVDEYCSNFKRAWPNPFRLCAVARLPPPEQPIQDGWAVGWPYPAPIPHPTPLYIAMLNPESQHTASLLIRRGAKMFDGYYPALHFAVGLGRVDLVKQIISVHGAGVVTELDFYRLTALHYLHYVEDVQTARELLNILAPHFPTEPRGLHGTPFHCALHARQWHIALLLLEEGGADPDIIRFNTFSMNAIHYTWWEMRDRLDRTGLPTFASPTQRRAPDLSAAKLALTERLITRGISATTFCRHPEYPHFITPLYEAAVIARSVDGMAIFIRERREPERSVFGVQGPEEIQWYKMLYSLCSAATEYKPWFYRHVNQIKFMVSHGARMDSMAGEVCALDIAVDWAGGKRYPLLTLLLGVAGQENVKIGAIRQFQEKLRRRNQIAAIQKFSQLVRRVYPEAVLPLDNWTKEDFYPGWHEQCSFVKPTIVVEIADVQRTD